MYFVIALRPGNKLIEPRGSVARCVYLLSENYALNKFQNVKTLCSEEHEIRRMSALRAGSPVSHARGCAVRETSLAPGGSGTEIAGYALRERRDHASRECLRLSRARPPIAFLQ